MKPTRKSALMLGVVMLVFALMACVILPSIQPTPTPLPTATFTATNTATATRTATATPLPPVQITSCALLNDCPDSPSIVSFLEEEVYTNIEYQVSIPYDARPRFAFGWCAIDEATLQQNLGKMQLIFTIDGVSYVDALQMQYTNQQDQNDPTLSYPCFYVGAVLRGWHIGETHQVSIGYSNDVSINDGWDTYDPGTWVYIYNVVPGALPTATFTPTRTATPRPLPTIPYYTPTPACEASASIIITNDTGGTLTLYLNGPASYSFYLGPGDTTLSVCPGSCNYTAYGCGGASDVGVINSGEAHRFYCQ